MIVIYTEETLSLIFQRDGAEETNKLIAQGKIISTEGLNYLKIEE